ncbi:hypothetical protein HG537_0A00720 [Torulaspora globosa]|uniref:Mitochondrial carrier n=1 Tax=Torulaspora globosa TaxID=48254 RepID=A0A7H9HN92_9SACH|nr:hypothetical protein HG537_0A00720 [Torulaspora sp. CBS 2947]
MERGSSESLTIRERMLSAGVGSLLTSLILTPMDVVRIRLQQQEMLPDCSCDVSVSKGKVSVAPGSEAVFWQDPCFKELNCKSSQHRFKGTIEAFGKIAQNEGLFTLWRGISVTLLMAIPANVVYFTGYEYMRDISPIEHSYPAFNPLVCGALARILAATTVAPFELVRTRLQSIPKSSKSTTTRAIMRDLLLETQKEVASSGYKVLFRGLQITLWRDVPFSAIYWGSYEFSKKHLWHPSNPASSSADNLSNWSFFAKSFISGCLSGAIAAVFTHPFDVGKTRWQISYINPQVTSITSPVVNKNMFKFIDGIRRREGIRSLYTGLSVRVAKIAPSCAIMISSYEISKRIFSS